MLDEDFKELIDKVEVIEHDVRFNKDIMSLGQRNELFRKLYYVSGLVL